MTREFSNFLVYRVRVPRGASRQRDTVRPIGLDRNQVRMSNFSIHPSSNKTQCRSEPPEHLDRFTLSCELDQLLRGRTLLKILRTLIRSEFVGDVSLSDDQEEMCEDGMALGLA
jgi:hypothetical protein